MHHSSIGVVEFLLPHIVICVGSKKEDFYDHKSTLTPPQSAIIGRCVPAVTLTGPQGAHCSCKVKRQTLMMKRVKVSMMKVG